MRLLRLTLALGWLDIDLDMADKNNENSLILDLLENGFLEALQYKYTTHYTSMISDRWSSVFRCKLLYSCMRKEWLPRSSTIVSRRSVRILGSISVEWDTMAALDMGGAKMGDRADKAMGLYHIRLEPKSQHPENIVPPPSLHMWVPGSV